MDVRAILIALMVISMCATFVAVYLKTRSFRMALLLMLIVGTKWTIAISLFGYDKPLIQFYLVNRRNPAIYKTITVTVCQVISTAYILSMAVTLAWPLIVRQLPRSIRADLKRMVSYEEVREVE